MINSNCSYNESFTYHCGEVHGLIRIYLTRIDDNQARLVASIAEHRVPQ